MGVQAYWLYFLSFDDTVARVVELDCADDDEAIRAAARLAEGRHAELWQMTRLVQTFKAAEH